MFINIISKPIITNTLFTVVLGALLSIAVSFVLPNRASVVIPTIAPTPQSSFDVAKAFHLQTKKVVRKKVIKQENSKEFLLKDFSITAILLDANQSIVIVRNAKNDAFVYLNGIYKGYKLVEVYSKKAKFKKGVNYYWSFLDPLDEKKFDTNPQNDSSSVVKSEARETVSVDMFEDIKFKNGVYFIPRTMLNDSASINRYMSSMGALLYNDNGVMSFKITYIAPNSIFHKLDIRKGDYIVAFNGKPFTSMQEPLAFYKNLSSVESLTLTVKRGNKKKELKYEVY